MEDKYKRFFDTLKHRLTLPLPGATAQQKMASSSRLALGQQAVPNARTRKSAVLILLYPYMGDLHLPLIERPTYDGVHSGQIGLPGGRYELYDRSLQHTALREAQEEIGIKASDVRVLGDLTQLYVHASNYLVQPVVGYLPYRPDFFPDPHEVAQILKVNLSVLADKNIIGTKELFVRNTVLNAPFYNLNGHTVWGATAMILSEFLMVLEEIEAAGEGV